MYAAVQGGHALADLALRHPKTFREWGNSYLIYLKVKNLSLLTKWLQTLEDLGIDYGRFYEPDIGSELTAISCFAPPSLTRGLSTLKLRTK